MNILEKSGKYSCKSVDSGNAFISAKFDTVKCTFLIKISGADMSGSGKVVFGLNVFGNPLVASESVTLPFGFESTQQQSGIIISDPTVRVSTWPDGAADKRP